MLARVRAVEVEAMARGLGLGDIAAALARLALLGARLSYADGRPRASGGSKLGGLPDLPPELEWPLRMEGQPSEGEPMRFVAQLGLAETGAVLPWPHDATPDSMLWFFCASDDGLVDEPDSGLVLLFGSGGELEPHEPPAAGAQPVTLNEVAISATPELTLPPSNSVLLEPLALRGYEGERIERYWQLCDELAERQGLTPPAHRVLGHPDALQGDVLDQAAFFADRALGGGGTGSEAEATDERLGELWGDGGMLYFCIRAEDLQSARYDRVQALTQSG
jgi:uncharacterized protein DUF1963